MKIVDQYAVINAVLAADVANNGTVDVAYPAGFTQNSFNANLGGPNGSVIVNKNDKWTVAAGKVSFSFGASTITITNTSTVTWKAGSEIVVGVDQQDGVDLKIINIPVILVGITGAMDVVTDMRLGVEGTIESVDWVTTAVVTTAAKLATLTPSIDGTPITGGAVALTSAAATPLGKVISGSAPTAGNVLKKESKFGIKATAVTAFAEGQGFLSVRIRTQLPNAY